MRVTNILATAMREPWVSHQKNGKTGSKPLILHAPFGCVSRICFDTNGSLDIKRIGCLHWWTVFTADSETPKNW